MEDQRFTIIILCICSLLKKIFQVRQTTSTPNQDYSTRITLIEHPSFRITTLILGSKALPSNIHNPNLTHLLPIHQPQPTPTSQPSHADATYDMKYGIRAVQGGGRSSTRETIGRVAAGEIAKIILKEFSGTE
ncbi:hypothetical protein UlMin_015580, partial [Ulmus minor]